MKIGILYICTGKYSIFWKSFYESAEKYFLTNHKKIYYVFTDAKKIEYQTKANIVKIYQKKLAWPFSTMSRFKYFIESKDLFKNSDYLIFCNANLLFVDKVDNEMLPLEEDYVALLQPSYWNKPRNEFPYETNPQSLAYIPANMGKHYFMGSLNGGKTFAFLKMCEVLDHNINEDLKKGIIAVWHDESHLNSYLMDKKVKLLNPSYGYPEDWDLPFNAKILIRDKRKYASLNELRDIKTTCSLFSRIINSFKRKKEAFGG